jgi:hypothetical protein
MKIFNAGRRTVVCLIAFGLCFSIIPIASAATLAAAMQKPGGVRGDKGQTLRVLVNLNGVLLKNVAATVSITAADGTVVVSGMTSKSGAYSTALDAGTYTVTVTTTHYTATQSVTIVESTSPEVVTVKLTAKAARPETQPTN